MNEPLNLNPAIVGKLEDLTEQVRQLKPGGDLEGLLQRETEQLKTIVFEQAIQIRKLATAADPAVFPPSGLPTLPAHDAPKRP